MEGGGGGVIIHHDIDTEQTRTYSPPPPFPAPSPFPLNQKSVKVIKKTFPPTLQPVSVSNKVFQDILTSTISRKSLTLKGVTERGGQAERERERDRDRQRERERERQRERGRMGVLGFLAI